MEQSRDLARNRVNARKVRSLVPIASAAREREVVGRRLAPVLQRDDVVNLEPQTSRRLRHSAVLAAIKCPSANKLIERFSHLPSGVK